jgi:rhamnosyltransferase
MQSLAEQVSRVMAIVVTLDSDVHDIEANLAGCSPCMHTVLCDNSEDEASRISIRTFAESQGFTYLSMDGNQGIGHAQNRGFAFAEQAGAEFVLLLDDDSQFTCGALSGLIDTYRGLRLKGERVGAVCALPVDRHYADRRHPGEANTVSPCREMMSSGSLIAVDALRDAGGMDESLFVDYVDFEWGWRAIAHGYKVYLANGVTFSHSLGDGILTVAGMKIRLKSPIRHYYQTRNSLRLLRRPYVPMPWKIKNTVLTLIKSAVFPICMAPRRLRFSYILRGLKDAFLGSGTGRYQTQ